MSMLADAVADDLLRERRPHPTIPQGELDALRAASAELLTKAQLNLRLADRHRQHGPSFEALYQAWRGRVAQVLWVRSRLNDAVVRREDVETVPLWDALHSVRAALNESLGVA